MTAQRTHVLRARVSPTERRDLEAQAEECDRPLSTYLREVIGIREEDADDAGSCPHLVADLDPRRFVVGRVTFRPAQIRATTP